MSNTRLVSAERREDDLAEASLRPQKLGEFIGQVDITRGMGETPPGFVSITAPPVIVRGTIVTGHQVLDGQKRWAPSAPVNPPR